MKRTLAWLLTALLILMSVPAALAQEVTLENVISVPSASQVEDTVGFQEGTELVVGTMTAPSGYFSTDMWGTNTSDLDVRALLHDYSTVAWLRSQDMMINGMAVAGVQVMPGENNNRIYNISLMTDLVYNDGTPITAKDYIFSLLLSCAPEIGEIGGTTRGLQHLVGFDAYISGEAPVFAGVRLLSDYAFSLEVSSDYLPFFYGLAMLDVTPYPMHVIAPGCDIADDGEGAYITTGADAAGMDEQALGFTPGVFSADMLRITMLDPEEGYVFNPRVTSGPYSLESYDKDTQVATFVINQLYLGNYEGKKPHIERLVLKTVDESTMFQEMAAGEIGILNKVSGSDEVTAGLALTAGEDATARQDNYPRSGLAFLAFACEEGVTSYPAVRQAIAHLVDKESIMLASMGNYGVLVNGYYGAGQWMITYTADENTEKELPAVNIPESLETLAVPFDVEEAKKLLAGNGWLLNAEGKPYEEGVDDIRYRDIDGELTPLVIRWAKTENNNVASLIESAITGTFKEAGIGLEITEVTFDEVLSQYYRLEERAYDMFFLASNFMSTFDPYYEYNTADIYQGLVNTSGLRDEQLMLLAKDMRETEAMEMQAYAVKWLAFQERWVEQMPMVPLYSSIYFDFYANDVQDYSITQHSGWSRAILYTWIGEAPEVDETDPFQTTDDGEDAVTADPFQVVGG